MAARTTAVIEKWSTGSVEPERRLDYWIGAVCECFLEMDITTAVRTDFDCSVQRGQLDIIGINRVEGSAQHVYRRKASLARSATARRFRADWWRPASQSVVTEKETPFAPVWLLH